jgi:hypothetical protein
MMDKDQKLIDSEKFAGSVLRRVASTGNATQSAYDSVSFGFTTA